MDFLTICISVLVATVTATWSISQYVHTMKEKHIAQLLQQKIEAVLKTVQAIQALLSDTRQTYVTKNEFNLRCQLVDANHSKLAQDVTRELKEIKDREAQINSKLDQHILDWAKSGK